MTTLRITLSPLTPFGSPLLGETLFGQLCWAIVRTCGEERLKTLLNGYASGHPFVVLSDAFPKGHLPLPALPDYCWAEEGSNAERRKYLKKKTWLPEAFISTPPAEWRRRALTDAEAAEQLLLKPVQTEGSEARLSVSGTVIHNSINRMSGTTGTGAFAPFAKRQIWLNPAVPLEVYAVLDESRFTLDELARCMEWIGLAGYGRDASAGLGKFETKDLIEARCGAKKVSHRTFLTLASSVLSGTPQLDAEKCFWRTRTHFGRHGDERAITGMPFKRPILMAEKAAVVAFTAPFDGAFIGRGLSGVSLAHPETVHQGYAPVYAIPDIF